MKVSPKLMGAVAMAQMMTATNSTISNSVKSVPTGIIMPKKKWAKRQARLKMQKASRKQTRK